MWEHGGPRYEIVYITDLFGRRHSVTIFDLVIQGLAAVMWVAGQRAKNDDTQVRPGSGDEVAAELPDGVDEGDKAVIVDWL